jgi:hypothetical protein
MGRGYDDFEVEVAASPKDSPSIGPRSRCQVTAWMRDRARRDRLSRRRLSPNRDLVAKSRCEAVAQGLVMQTRWSDLLRAQLRQKWMSQVRRCLLAEDLTQRANSASWTASSTTSERPPDGQLELRALAWALRKLYKEQINRFRDAININTCRQVP